MIVRWIVATLKAWTRFADDQRGQIAVIFALSSTALVVGLGASVDLSRAFAARQKLSQVAELTCQYSVRPSVVATANSSYASTYGASGGFSTYVAAVNAFATKALAGQQWTGSTPTAPSGTYFTATAAASTYTSETGTAPTSPTVELSAAVPTYFLGIVNVAQITVHAKIACLTASSTPPIVNAPGAASTTNLVLREGFENTCGSLCYLNPYGGLTPLSTPIQTTPSTPMYTGNYGQKWYILGYCLEIDQVGSISSTAPDGSHTAELDCDNGGSTAGNSSISTQVYLAPGHYELRYSYRSRVDYPNYDPAYICGTTAADVSFANDTVIGAGPTQDNGSASRTNQINVYLDMVTSASVPLHATRDGTQQLGGSNLVDMCVYAPAWIQRSVKITVLTPAYYWLSFAADGQNDSFGGQLDAIELCQETCTASLSDSFPPSWLAANNGGVNKVLFEDSFESPTYAPDPYTSTAHSKGGNLANSYGTTVSTGCVYAGVTSTYASPPGWPCQKASGWTTAPYNQVVYWEQGAAQGSQYITLQGWNGVSTPTDPINRIISRPFLLDPGYYAVSYDYLSMIDFSATANISGTNCTAAPASGDIYDTSFFTTITGQERYSGNYSVSRSTDILGVFMSDGLSTSTPNGGATLGGAATFTNLDGTTTSAPELAAYGVTWSNYSASVVNPVIDTCGYASGFAWVPRAVSVEITKPGLYWLTFSAYGDALTGAGAGPAIDDVTLTALGGPYMSGAPTTAITVIPTPAPQHDIAYYGLNSAFNGFYIIADPFAPPAADQ
jgi:Flp pilus assembly protein TadG